MKGGSSLALLHDPERVLAPFSASVSQTSGHLIGCSCLFSWVHTLEKLMGPEPTPSFFPWGLGSPNKWK